MFLKTALQMGRYAITMACASWKTENTRVSASTITVIKTNASRAGCYFWRAKIKQNVFTRPAILGRGRIRSSAITRVRA